MPKNYRAIQIFKNQPTVKTCATTCAQPPAINLTSWKDGALKSQTPHRNKRHSSSESALFRNRVPPKKLTSLIQQVEIRNSLQEERSGQNNTDVTLQYFEFCILQDDLKSTDAISTSTCGSNDVPSNGLRLTRLCFIIIIPACIFCRGLPTNSGRRQQQQQPPERKQI